MQKKTVFLVIVPLALAATAIAVFLSQPHHEQGDDRTLHLYGNVAIREAQLAFNSSEHIAEIHVQEGDRVSKGQLLAHLHTELLEAQATLLAQQQVVAKLEAGSRPQEIRKAQAELKAAQGYGKGGGG